MFQKIEGAPEYGTFDLLVKELKWRYRRTHPDELEGLHYRFDVCCLSDGKSGFIKAERLEDSPNQPNPRTETLLVENNTVVARVEEELRPCDWIS